MAMPMPKRAGGIARGRSGICNLLAEKLDCVFHVHENARPGQLPPTAPIRSAFFTSFSEAQSSHGSKSEQHEDAQHVVLESRPTVKKSAIRNSPTVPGQTQSKPVKPFLKPMPDSSSLHAAFAVQNLPKFIRFA